MKLRTLVEYTPEERLKLYAEHHWKRRLITTYPNKPAWWHPAYSTNTKPLFTLLEMIELLPQP